MQQQKSKKRCKTIVERDFLFYSFHMMKSEFRMGMFLFGYFAII